MIVCFRCLDAKKRGDLWTDCPAQRMFIKTTGRDSANAKIKGFVGAGRCHISDDYASKMTATEMKRSQQCKEAIEKSSNMTRTK